MYHYRYENLVTKVDTGRHIAYECACSQPLNLEICILPTPGHAPSRLASNRTQVCTARQSTGSILTIFLKMSANKQSTPLLIHPWTGYACTVGSYTDRHLAEPWNHYGYLGMHRGDRAIGSFRDRASRRALPRAAEVRTYVGRRQWSKLCASPRQISVHVRNCDVTIHDSIAHQTQDPA